MHLPEICEEEVHTVAARLGVRPWRRVHVYVFANYREVRNVMGGTHAAYAEPSLRAAMVPCGPRFRWLVRHELGHVFAGGYGIAWPFLKSEGLAVWVECDGSVPCLGEPALAQLPHFEEKCTDFQPWR